MIARPEQRCDLAAFFTQLLQQTPGLRQEKTTKAIRAPANAFRGTCNIRAVFNHPGCQKGRCVLGEGLPITRVPDYLRKTAKKSGPLFYDTFSLLSFIRHSPSCMRSHGLYVFLWSDFFLQGSVHAK
jgi:hypothetical protein